MSQLQSMIAFEQVAQIMAKAPVLVEDFKILEEAIHIARKEVNKELYGCEEPNALVVIDDTINKEEGNESVAINDSAERALA